MTDIGYTLSSEEHGPNDLVDHAVRAERAGFDFAVASDHYHPWTTTQGESPFVWGTLGGVARATDDLEVGTGVTCPLIRIHPAIVAQAAATATTMFDGRFFLGVGTGERLNEHVLGDRWPPHHVRLEMLEEAVGLMRELWQGGMQSHDGDHYTVADAGLFTRPDDPPPVAVAASGPTTATAAGELGDALVSTAPDGEVVDAFADGDGDDRPRYGQLTACYAGDEAEARETVHEWWPNTGLPGELGQELATPAHFEQATELVTPERATEHVPCGPDADRHVEAIQSFVDAGFDHVYVHQVGPEQDRAIEFYEREVLPSFS